MIQEVQEMMRVQAESVGADAIVSFRLKIGKIEQRRLQNDLFEVFILANGVGDAVQVQK